MTYRQKNGYRDLVIERLSQRASPILITDFYIYIDLYRILMKVLLRECNYVQTHIINTYPTLIDSYISKLRWGLYLRKLGVGKIVQCGFERKGLHNYTLIYQCLSYCIHDKANNSAIGSENLR